jgi:hypothetical protein
VEGASTALDPDSIDPVTNDDPDSWITCTAPYGDVDLGNTGTPGAGNEACGGGPVEGTCTDGGRARPIVSPTAGQILVTEALANPAGTGEAVDPGHEWFELTALAAFDLNGLQLGKGDAVAQTLDDAACLSVTSGTRLVFAQSREAGSNGGLPRVDFVKAFQLNNSAGSVFVSVGGVELHRLAYGNGVEGRATQLDPDGATLCTTPATDAYGTAGDLGTPGAANPACPPAAAP